MSSKLKFSVPKSYLYEWIAGTLKCTNYFKLTKRDKGPIHEYMGLIISYSWPQLKRLIAQYQEQKWIGQSLSPHNTFTKRYTHIDICLLAQTDKAHQMLSRPATKKLFERAYHVYGEFANERLASIFVTHLYNLCKSTGYI